MNAHDATGGQGRRSVQAHERAWPHRDETAHEIAHQLRNELTVAVDRAARAERPGIPDARGEPVEETVAPSTREALLDVAARGHRLARLLDGLSARYATPGATRPPDVHVALDQAAAAAEDLGNCAQAAARALEDPDRDL